MNPPARPVRTPPSRLRSEAAAALAALLPLLPSPAPAALPWDTPAPPPKGTELVLTQPAPPDPPPEGSIMDLPGERNLPLNWRSTEKASEKARGHAGLSWLMASGSGQFSREELYAMREVLRRYRVVVVDLRQEPHTFLNGAAISWGPPAIVGATRDAPQVERIEHAWTDRLVAKKFTTVTQYSPDVFANSRIWTPLSLRLDIREAAVESRLVAEARWGYFRIAAPDSDLPRDADVDRFVALVRELDGDIWLHFHCDTGRDRTALYLTLYDMMRHYVRASRPEIITRQRQLGRIDYLTGPARAERARFLERFFSYCWECGPLFRRSWSSWSRENPPD